MDQLKASFGPQEKEAMEKQDPTSAPDCDWSQLPADLLVQIFAMLDVFDLFSVGGVCPSWRVSHLEARRLGTSGRNQSPCLIYSDDDHEPTTATLHSLSTNKLNHIALPDPPFRSRFVVGSSHGWLITADEQSQLLLINPITRAQVALPPPTTIKNVQCCYTAEGVLDSYNLFKLDLEIRDCNLQVEPDDLSLEEGRFYFYLRVAMSADPSSGNCIVIILHMPEHYISFARLGDTQWTWIDVDKCCVRYLDFFYSDSDGLFYAIRKNAEVHTIDLNGPSPVVKVILNPMTHLVINRYIVQAPWGAILQVWRNDIPIKKGEYRAVKLEVYSVDKVEQKLVKVKNLQDHVLFIGFNTPFFLPAKDFPKLNPNCICLTDDNMDFFYSYKFGPRQVVVFNMEDGSFTDLLPDGNSWLNWPTPTWIRPSCYQDIECQYRLWFQ